MEEPSGRQQRLVTMLRGSTCCELLVGGPREELARLRPIIEELDAYVEKAANIQ